MISGTRKIPAGLGPGNDRDRDHSAAQGDLLEHLPGDPESEDLGSEQIWVQQRRLLLALAAHEPLDQLCQRDCTDRGERPDRFSAFLPRQDAEHDATHAQNGQDRTDGVNTIAMTTTSRRNATRHDR